MAETEVAPSNKTIVYQGRKPMPWSGQQFAQRHNKKLHGEAATKAGEIANAVLKESGDEGKAARIANWQVKRMRKRGVISDKAARKTGLDAPRDVDASAR